MMVLFNYILSSIYTKYIIGVKILLLHRLVSMQGKGNAHVAPDFVTEKQNLHGR